MTQSKSEGLDFVKVEALRNHLLLTMEDMAKLFGVTRLSYFKWVHGAPPRATRLKHIRTVLRKLLAITKEHQWPNPVRSLDRETRLNRLLELLSQY